MKKSQWTKAKETLKNMMLFNIAEFEKDIKDYATLRTAVLNGTRSFKELSENGEYYFWDRDLAKLFCTPKRFEKLLTMKRLPLGINGFSWLELQTQALGQCMIEIAMERGYKLSSQILIPILVKKEY